MAITIAGKHVGPIGFGLMGLTARQQPLSEEACFSAIKAALDAGCNYFNGGEFYGTPENNSLTLVRKYFDLHPEDAGRVVLNVKGALGPGLVPNGSKEYVTSSIQNVLSMLGPIGHVDQYEPARKDIKVDYETDTLATIQEFVSAGKIGGIALSEVNVNTLRSAAKKFNITALEVELSLFQTKPLTSGILEACGELGIPVLAHSPLGQGLLGGSNFHSAEEYDSKRHLPRFHEQNLKKNLELVAKIEMLAKKKACTTAQIAINWLLSLSTRPGMPTIIPIPGSSNPERIRENAKIIDLTPEDIAEISEILQKYVPAGEVFPEEHMKHMGL